MVSEKETKVENIEINEEELDAQWKSMNEEERNRVCLYQKLPVTFLKKHQKEINWTNISLNAKTLTFEVLDNFASKISWPTICICPRDLHESLLYNYRTKIIWTAVLSHQRLRLEFLILMSEIYRKSRAKNMRDFWDAVSRYEEIDHEYVDAYKRFINFRLLSNNPHITEETIDKYILKLDIDALMKTVTIPKKIMEKHKDIFLQARGQMK